MNIRQIRPLNYIGTQPTHLGPIALEGDVRVDTIIHYGNQRIWWWCVHQRWQQSWLTMRRRVGKSSERVPEAPPDSCPASYGAGGQAQLAPTLVSYYISIFFGGLLRFVLLVTLVKIGLKRCVGPPDPRG